MNREQQKYLIKRIDEEWKNKIKQIEAECGPKVFYDSDKRYAIIENKLPIRYSMDELYALLANDKIRYVIDLFDTTAFDPNNQTNKELCNKRKSALYDRVQNIKDNIMLGDSEEALKIFAAFVKEEF
jgi:hypothetical protein